MNHPTASCEQSHSVAPSRRRWVLVRHGETEERARGRLIGRTDVSLSASGRREVAKLAPPLLRFLPALCLVSPLRRARETAELALPAARAAPRMEDWLQEIDFGAWDGLTFEEAKARNPEAVAGWMRDEAQFRFPEGESVPEFSERVTEGARRIMAAGEADDRRAAAALHSSTVLAIAHAGVIRVLLCHFLGIPLSRNRVFQIDHAAISVVDLFDGVGTLVALNQRPAAWE